MSHRESGGSPNYSFKPSVKAVWLFAVFFSLFVALGFWQLQRADEKVALNVLRDTRSQEPPRSLKDVAAEVLDVLRYRPVWMEGQYDTAHQFLLDNQLQGQSVGYQVLTPLRLSGMDKAVLVNRGWVPQGSSRRVLPNIDQAPPGTMKVIGIVERFHRVGFQLEGADIPADGWPSVVQLPQAEKLAERLGYSVLPYQVLLDPAADGGYSRVWQVVRLDSDKNRGYALQWFLFAGLVTFFFVRYSFKAKSG